RAGVGEPLAHELGGIRPGDRGRSAEQVRELGICWHHVSMVTEDDVRRVALSLPRTTEKPSYGTPGFRVKDKLFARIREEGDVLVVWVAGEGEKQGLIAAEPAKFFTTPHYDGPPSVLVRLPAVDIDELTELLTDSWRLRAPKRVAAELD